MRIEIEIDYVMCFSEFHFRECLNSLSARIFTVFGHFHSLLEDRVLHKEEWVAKLPATSVSRSIKRLNFQVEITHHWHLKG